MPPQVSLSKGQSREGAFINRSLLTLGTVISKLSDRHAAHVPFRDSKLTRLLCASLSGSGAKVAVIATITPASSQAEETHNTLKFATRAKKVSCWAWVVGEYRLGHCRDRLLHALDWLSVLATCPAEPS